MISKRNNKLLLPLELIMTLILFCVSISSVNALSVGESKNYGPYNGQQSFTATEKGYYQLEAWGAQGGGNGGYGAYTTGVVLLEKGQTIYISVGGVGAQYNGGYNGGGNGGLGSKGQWGFGGGGATHFAKDAGLLSALKTKTPSILIVASGGGGGCSAQNCPSGHGGGIQGANGYDTVNKTTTAYTGIGATLTRAGYSFKGGVGCGAGSFGVGGPVCLNEGYGGAGGGAGWYGGGGSNRGHGAGGGGTSYMSEEITSYGGVIKATYCYGCTTSNAEGTRTISTTSSNSNAITNSAKLGAGYARITLKAIYSNPNILELKLKPGKITPVFDSNTYEYEVSLGAEESYINIEAVPAANTNKITGLGEIPIPSGTTNHTITSTSTSGNIATYVLHITRPKSSYPYLKDIKVNNKSLEDFESTKLTYETTVPFDEETLNLEIIKGRAEQDVHTSDLKLHSGRNEIKITVTSEDKNQTVEYTLIVNKEHTSKLKSLEVSDYLLSPAFNTNTYTYNVEILSHTMSLTVTALPFDEEAKVKVEGLGYIKSNATGKIIVTEPNSTETVYTINVTKINTPPKTDFDFPYTGTIETFTPTISAYYQLETWGSQGGGNGGFGAYSTGVVYLNRGETIYIGVGGTGAKYNGGYNGGGAAGNGNGQNAYGGGGATHIAKTTGLLTSLSNNQNNILIVAAGGGGSTQNGNSSYGHGGGYLGANGYDIHNRSSNAYNGVGASTTGPGFTANAGANCGRGAFGRGGNFCNMSYGGAGGGAGFYGGGGSNRGHGTGAGGSSYLKSTDLISYGSVTKATYCYSCATNNTESLKTISTGNVSANPISNYAKKGAGYARIKMLRIPSENNVLDELTITIDGENEKYTPELSYDESVYTLNLTDSNKTSGIIKAVPADSSATVEGTGDIKILSGTNTYKITVTAESGAKREYTLIITRPASNNAKLANITISGLTPSLCEANDIFCHTKPETFDPDNDSYTLVVPGKIKQVWFNVTKGHEYQTVTGDGKVELAEGENNFTITVTSEDKSTTKEYHYQIIRDSSDNPDLNSLEVIDPSIDIGFDPSKTEYSFSIPNNYEEIELKVTPAGEYSKYVIIGNEKLQIGTNQIIVAVTASSGDMKFYFLNVYREKNSNTYLSDLKVTTEEQEYALTPNFDKLTTGTYQVTVPNEVTEINITAIPEEDTTKVTGDKQKTLHTGVNEFRITVTAENSDTETYVLEVTREKNNNPNLSSITLTNGTNTYPYTPAFQEDETEYTLEVDSEITYLNITATPKEPTTTYKLLENNALKIGENKKHILAIAEDGTTKTYTITMNRNMSSDNYLKDIELSTGTLTPNFDREINAYEIIVPNETASINITGIKNDPKSTIAGNGKYSLIVGQNEIELNVTSESGNIRTYVLTITREKNSNAYLSNITLSEGTLNESFEKNNLNYTVNVPNEIKSIEITGTPEAKTTKVIGSGNYNLTTGENRFTLTTLASDNKSTLTYVITVTRAKSSNNNLKHLLLEEATLTPEFTKEETNYTAYVPNEISKSVFHIETEDEKATYQIIGNTEFQVGENIVKVEVTSESGSKKEYIIKVYRQEDFTGSDYLSSLEVDKGTLTPSFNKEIPYYEVNVPHTVKEITVTGTKEDINAEIKGEGTYLLNPGKNLIVVTVTSTEGNIRDYQIMVNREASNEARLERVTLESSVMSPNFDKDTFEYSVETSEKSLNFQEIVPIDPEATYKILGNNFEEIGIYDVIIRVTASNKQDRKEYIFHVEKTASNNNNLASLEVEGYSFTPEFNKATTYYDLTVPSDTNTIVINASAEDDAASITGIGLQNLSPGDNTFVIKVTSESGKVKSYTIVVHKETDNVKYLRDLIVNNGTMAPEFTKENAKYDVVVESSEESLDLTVILESDKSSYIITGNNLKLGMNTVNVIVTSESGDIFTYQLSVVRKEVVNALLENIAIKNYKLNPKFNRYLNHYDLKINYESEDLELTITPEDKNATWQIEGLEENHTGTETINVNNIPLGSSILKINVTSSDGEKTETYTINVTRQNLANDFLSYLYTSEGELTPTFSGTIMEYTIDVSDTVSEIELFGASTDSSVKIEGLGIYNLKPGKNEFEVKVTTKTNIERIYYITVNKEKNTNNFLESLIARTGFTIHDLNPEFQPTTTNYEITVPLGTPNITLEGTFNDSASVSGLGTYDLKGGTNTFEVIVTSESGESKTYKINIVRESDTNNHLISITPSIGILSPDFNYEETNYELHLDESASSLSFEVVTESNYATVAGTESEIVPDGISTRTITVTAEDGSTRTYTITVYKERKDNAKLKSLSVKDYNFMETFAPDTFEYHIKVPNDKKVLFQSDVTALPESDNATIKTSDNLSISTTSENVFIITVTAPDGFTKETYKIYVEREKGKSALLNNLEVKVGNLTSVFTPEKFEYDWAIPRRSKVTSNDLLPTPEDANATIEILTDEENKMKVKVTSEDGSTTNIYILNLVLSLIGDNTELEYLTPSAGTLEYSNDILEYAIEVPEETEKISFDALAVDPDATITGIEETPLKYGENEITITVIAADKVTTRTIKVKVTRPKNLISIIPDEESIVLDLKEIKKILYTLNPEDTTNSEVRFESEDETIASVDEFGNVTGLSFGDTTINIISTEDETITTSVRVLVIRKYITTTILDIKRHSIEEKNDIPDAEDYIIGIDPKTSVDLFKSKLENRPQFIHIYNLDGEKIEGETIIGNGFVVKLICEGVTYDELTIIVRGDLNSDGYVNVADYSKLNSRLLKLVEFNFAERIAADLNNDSYVNVADYSKLNSFLLKITASLNNK